MRFSIALYFVFLLLISCKNDEDLNPIIITKISPTAGPHSSVVTITGSGFSSNPVSNLVKFNGKNATVQSATATQLIVLVPKSAGTGAVSVRHVSGPRFTYEFTAVVSTLAGSGQQGFTNATGTSASFNYPHGITIDASGNVYVADSFNNAIRKITPAGVVTTLTGNGSIGYTNGTGVEATFNGPKGLTIDKNGNLYVSDTNNGVIRKITSSGLVTTVAGTENRGYQNGDGANAQFLFPTDVAIDNNENLFVTDTGNRRIRKISSAGEVSTFAGSGASGNQNGPASSASFTILNGITIASNGDMFTADEDNHSIRKITTGGIVSHLAGAGGAGFLDGSIDSAKFRSPYSMVVDKANNLYVTDQKNHRIRKITPDGMVSTLAGGNKSGFNNGNGQNARFSYPRGITIDKNGVIYVADSWNHRIRKIVLE